jgi:hypothetical protein
MGASVARSPSANVRAVFREGAEQQAAYDFVQHPKLKASAIVESSGSAAASRARQHARVLVAIDGSSVTLRDPYGARGAGSVGNLTNGARGVKLMAALAMTEEGIPFGLADLRFWTRPISKRRRSHKLRPVSDRETQHQLDARQAVRERFAREAPDTEYVFIEDRAGDCWPVLLSAFVDRPNKEHSIIRASWDRRAIEDGEPLPPKRSAMGHLRPLMRRARSLGRIDVQLSATSDRRARVARIELRSASVTLDLLQTPNRNIERVRVNVVWAHEVGAPRGVEAIDWMLLTDLPVKTLKQSRYVVALYTQRWRVEDLFKVAKGGVRDVEKTRLRSLPSIERWLAIQFAASVRTQRIARMAREQPEADALTEFDRDELDAIRDLLADQGAKPLSDSPRIVDVARALAKIGGSHGKGLPGVIVLARALETVRFAAMAARGRRLREAQEPTRRKRSDK